MKTFAEYEAGAAKTCTMKGNAEDTYHAIFGAVSEVGELGDAAKRRLVYGREFDPINVMEEAGDVLWYITKLVKTQGFTLADAARANIAKLDHRSREQRANIKLRDLEFERRLLTAALNNLPLPERDVITA